LLLRADQVIE